MFVFLGGLVVDRFVSITLFFKTKKHSFVVGGF